MLTMNAKKKLLIDKDEEVFSPKLLLDSINDSERGNLKPKTKPTHQKQPSAEDSTNYFIQIKEPRNPSC